jgi:CheY-like chemotaxis protein
MERMVKILIIDDNLVILRATARAMRKHGHEVVSAENGIEGLRLALEERPDRIICDFEMPGIDGAQVYAQLPADLQERLFLWSGNAPFPFPRPVIEKPSSFNDLMKSIGAPV